MVDPLATKLMAIGPLVLPGGVIAASVTYPCTDIVHEVYGRKYAKAIVTCGLLGILVTLLLIGIDTSLPAAEIWELEKSYLDIFGLSFRITVAGLIAFILGQYADVYLFGQIYRFTSGRFLWLRNNLSTAISKLFDVVSFNLIAFYGIYELNDLLSMTVGCYIFYVTIALLDTPFVYLGVWWIRKLHPDIKKQRKPILCTQTA